MQVEWLLKHFNDLSPHELYKILRLRNEVFVVEQQCIFQDADNNDQQAWHLMAFRGEELAAYTRLIPAGFVYEQPSIGRVVTAPFVRGTGMGKELMERSIAETYKLFGKQPIKIGAQLYLQKFYNELGFMKCSDVYLEDGIEHIYMIREVQS